MIFSLPFAPPWDGETRILGATLPLFFLPASGVGGLYPLMFKRFQEITPESKANSQPKIALDSALLIGGNAFSGDTLGFGQIFPEKTFHSECPGRNILIPLPKIQAIATRDGSSCAALLGLVGTG